MAQTVLEKQKDRIFPVVTFTDMEWLWQKNNYLEAPEGTNLKNKLNCHNENSHLSIMEW